MNYWRILEEGEIRDDDSNVVSLVTKSSADCDESQKSFEQVGIHSSHRHDDKECESPEVTASNVEHVESSVNISKKRKKERDSFEQLEKVLQVGKRAKHAVKDVSDKRLEQKRCRVKIPMIGRPKASDIPPSLPSLGTYEKCVVEASEIQEAQKRRVYRSSQPVEGNTQITGVEFPTYHDQTTQILDIGANVELVDDLIVGDEVEISETHKRPYEDDDYNIEGGAKKTKNVQLPEQITIIPDDKLAETVTADMFPLQLEGVVELPYVDISSGGNIAEIHSYAKVGGESIDPVKSQKSSVEKKQLGHKEQQVGIKTEPESSDSDDIVVTMVEKGFPAKVKHEAGTSSQSGNLMKIMSTDSRDEEFQRRVKILADVHQPRSSPQVTDIFADDYIPQNVVEVKAEAPVGQGMTREQEMLRIKDKDENVQLDVFIPPAAGGITKSAASMIYRPRDRMKGKEIVTVQQLPSISAVASAGVPVPAVQQLDDRYYCDKCQKSFKDLKYFRRHMK